MSDIDLHYRLELDDFRLDVTETIPSRGVTGVFGPSGSGKTTLLRCIAGLEPRASGSITVAGDTWENSAAGVSRAVQDRQVGYVFQEPRLFPHLDVRGNLE